MPEIGLDARLRFLDRSARVLTGTAPATSAHLMLERNTVAEEHGKALHKAQLQGICKACGTMSDADNISTSDPLRPNAASSKGRNWDSMPDHVLLDNPSNNECHACRRVVVKPSFQLQEYGRNKVTRTAASAKLPDNTCYPSLKHDLAKVGKVIPANLSSKNRAKARKQGGLQAMLEKAKEKNQQPSDTGLNLMDLIKKV